MAVWREELVELWLVVLSMMAPNGLSVAGEQVTVFGVNLRDVLSCSDGGREPEHVKEREHLGGNAVDGAVDDADDGDREATRNLRNGKHAFFSLGIGYLDTGDVLSAARMGAGAGLGAIVAQATRKALYGY